MFLRNHWYVAASDTEIARKPLGRTPIRQVRPGRVPHRAVVELLQVIAPLIVARAVLPLQRQVIHHRVPFRLVAIDEPDGDPRGMLEADGLIDD